MLGRANDRPAVQVDRPGHALLNPDRGQVARQHDRNARGRSVGIEMMATLDADILPGSIVVLELGFRRSFVLQCIRYGRPVDIPAGYGQG